MSLPAAENLLSRRQALALVLLCWAAIYLPAFGSLELKGEEGRRLLPAVAMLDGGSGWIVPRIGGVDYLSKPPLVNWLAAASLRAAQAIVGHPTRSEWAARAPSVLMVLALALTITGTLSRALTPTGALLAAVFTLTNLGLMEKGRLAEIEALYISLYGIALVLWMGGWRADALAAEVGGKARAAWRTWTLPWLFLGLGMLAKGPLPHLPFFYAVVLAVLGCAGRWRDFFNGAHLAGILLMLGIFAAWAVPYLHATAAERASGVWLAQFQGRLEVGEGFHLGAWLLNIPRGLVNYLPWAVLLPLLWRALPEDAPNVDRAILRGGRWAALGCFLAVSLAPGGQPRYTLPLLVPASVLLALACRRGWDHVEADGTLPPWLGDAWTRTAAVCAALAGVLAPLAALFDRGGGTLPWVAAAGVVLAAAWIVWRVVPWKLPPPWERVRPHRIFPLALASAAAMGLLTWDYAVGIVPHQRAHESVRPAARAINEAMAHDPQPAGTPWVALTVLRPGFVPFLYYCRCPGNAAIQYIQDTSGLGGFDPYWLLVRTEDLGVTLQTTAEWQFVIDRQLDVTDKRAASGVRDPKAATGRGQWTLLHTTPPPGGYHPGKSGQPVPLDLDKLQGFFRRPQANQP